VHFGKRRLGDVFPGGCFFVSAVAEFATHPGPVKERIAALLRGWLGTLEAAAAGAQAEGQIDGREDPAQLVLEIKCRALVAFSDFDRENGAPF
jgi:tetracycline repressor-like protein